MRAGQCQQNKPEVNRSSGSTSMKRDAQTDTQTDTQGYRIRGARFARSLKTIRHRLITGSLDSSL